MKEKAQSKKAELAAERAARKQAKLEAKAKQAAQLADLKARTSPVHTSAPDLLRLGRNQDARLHSGDGHREAQGLAQDDQAREAGRVRARAGMQRPLEPGPLPTALDAEAHGARAHLLLTPYDSNRPAEPPRHQLRSAAQAKK